MTVESYPVRDVAVHDGDTVRCRVRMVKRIKLPVELATSILGIAIELEEAEIVLRGSVPTAVRVAGVDTPEMRGDQRPAGEFVKAAVIDWFLSNGPCEIIFECRDKYAGRTVADFRSAKGGELLSEFLIRKKLAKPYDGGTKQAWTKGELKAIVERDEA
ncbi:MAG TPA: hypothetical protein VMY37_23610 [Thermoguttaceae bacterium]|nr:hypothetical protein [Thermoguttaceae bacterium]